MVTSYCNSDIIKFSVIIPLYNKEKSIRSTVESVLNQTYQYFELIIVNDGSKDNSLKTIESFSDERIRLVDKTNGGVSSARNTGIGLAKNDFIVFLDADDLWLPFCLEEFCTLINEFHRADVFCTNYNMTGKDLKGSDRRYFVKDYFYTSAYFMAKWSIPIMLIGCVAVRKHVFPEVGCFNQNITHGEDIDMWQRLSLNYKIAKSERITTIYRTESENRASLKNNESKLSGEKEILKRSSDLSDSQKLFYGIRIIHDLMDIKFSHDFSCLLDFLKYPDWVFKATFFIIKIRFLKADITSR